MPWLLLHTSFVCFILIHSRQLLTPAAVKHLASAHISLPKPMQQIKREASAEPSIFASISPLVFHATPPLHLRMELQPHAHLSLINILPIQLTIPPLQNLPVHARARLSQRRRPPLPALHRRQLHPAAHRLRDAELAAQKAHLHRVLLLLPGAEARFEGVRGGGGGRAGGFGRGRREVEVVAQGVMDAWGGGGAEGGGGGGCGLGGGD